MPDEAFGDADFMIALQIDSSLWSALRETRRFTILAGKVTVAKPWPPISRFLTLVAYSRAPRHKITFCDCVLGRIGNQR